MKARIVVGFNHSCAVMVADEAIQKRILMCGTAEVVGEYVRLHDLTQGDYVLTFDGGSIQHEKLNPTIAVIGVPTNFLDGMDDIFPVRTDKSHSKFSPFPEHKDLQ